MPRHTSHCVFDPHWVELVYKLPHAPTGFPKIKNEISTRLDAAVDKIQAAAKATSQELQTELRKSTESYVDSKMASVKSVIDSLRMDVWRLEAGAMEQEVDMWIDKEVYINALNCHVQHLRMVQRAGDNWKISGGLDKMETILKTLIQEQPDFRPDAKQIAELSEFLETVVKQNPVIVQRLQTLVAQVCGSGETPAETFTRLGRRR